MFGSASWYFAVQEIRRDASEQLGSPDGEIKNRHPLFGLLKGLTIVPPGVDLTEPADPDWGKVND